MMVRNDKILYVFVSLVLLQLIVGAQVKLAVYYESRGPDSSRFITEQVYPLLMKLGGVPNKFLEVEFVPYGKATTRKVRGVTKFECPHGPDECHGNKVHGCALNILTPKDAATFIHCSMTSLNTNTLKGDDSTCLKKLGGNGNKITACVNSSKIYSIVKAFGTKTAELLPKMYYAPWVVIDRKWTKDQQEDAEDNLEKLICLKLKKQGAKVVACAQYY